MGLTQYLTALLFLFKGINQKQKKRNCEKQLKISVDCVRRCYIGVLDIYMNPNTLTMMDLLEVGC